MMGRSPERGHHDSGRQQWLTFIRLDGAVDVATAAVDHVRLSSISRMEELPVQIDGEPWGMTPVEVEPMGETVELVVG